MMTRTKAPVPVSVDSVRPILHRKCACGAKADAVAQSCPDCERKKLQPKLIVGSQHAAEEREADRVADAVMRDGDGRAGAGVGAISSAVQRSSTGPTTSTGAQAPSIVDRVLERSGQALDSGARGFFERRFERDFSNVRVHADAEAAASARAVDALAYTVGNHLVFGASRYAPDTAAGRRLLAHELTHVVQQGATLRRLSMSSSLVPDEEFRDDEEEQPIRRLQRQAIDHGVEKLGADSTAPQTPQVDEREKALAECKRATPDPDVCRPSTPPPWSSFQGSVPVKTDPKDTTDYKAETKSYFEIVNVPSQKCEEKILGRASGPTMRFQGVFDPSLSWVKPDLGNAADKKKNGSTFWVNACKEHFKSGQTFAIKLPPVTSDCPADPKPRYDLAKNEAECSTVMGKDYNDWFLKVSNRLLRHEQKHFAVTCALAQKGNDALTEGKTIEQVTAALKEKWNTIQAKYDNETKHGCKAAAQATWNTAIAAGLPAIKLFE
jgi:hypothetical protein